MHDESDAAEQRELTRLLLENLPDYPPPTDRSAPLRERLVARAGRSAAENARFLTVRSRSGAWSDVRPGVRMKPLWRGPAGHSVLLRFAPGAGLPVHRHRWMEEGIVLEGGLQMDDLDLGPGDYHRSPAGSRHGRIGSRQGGLAYLRGTSLGDTAGVLGELLGGLLPGAGGRSATVYAADPEGWEPVAPSIRRKVLTADGPLASYFCRLDPGAELDGHGHAGDEECMMIKGELFLGDLLLQAGDYQLAPAGTAHGRIATDVGALLFVRGPLGH
jgi:quercetin dioxygenase-like cupin family protein